MGEERHRKPNDLGGLPAGQIDREEKEIEPWQKSIEATQRCLQARANPLVSVDELRRCMEELPPTTYRLLCQFERWAESLTALLIEKEVLNRAEIDERIRMLAERRSKDRA